MTDHPLHSLDTAPEAARPILAAAHNYRGFLFGAEAEAFLAGGFSKARALDLSPGLASAVRLVA